MDLYVQIRVYSWDTRLSNGLWEGRQPTLRLPLESIFSPDGLVPVRRSDGKEDRGALGDGDFVHDLSVPAYNRLRERQYRGLDSSGKC